MALSAATVMFWISGGTVIVVPLLQIPLPQVSPVVQTLPSSHGDVLLTWTQPTAGLQLSSVHGLPSLQSIRVSQSDEQSNVVTCKDQ